MSLTLAMFLLLCAAALLLLAAALNAIDAALGVRSRAELVSLAATTKRANPSLRLLAHAEDARTDHALLFARVFTHTLAVVLVTVVATLVFHRALLYVLLVTLLLALVTFAAVEATPRALGVRYPDRTIVLVAPMLRVVSLLFGPLASLLVRLGNHMTAGVGRTHIRDEQQLLSMIDQATEQAFLESDDRDYIHSLVEFGDTLVREVMVPRIDMVTVEHEHSVRAALEQMLTSRHTRIPVVSGDADDVIGIAHLRDASSFFLRHSDDAANTPVTRVMKPAMFVPEVMAADKLLRQMQHEATHLALVVDEYGGISGLVTLEDLIEELLGEITDEHDRDSALVEQNADGSYTVSARLPIAELGELFHIDLDDDEVDTVGGFVVKHLGRLAEPGDHVLAAGIALTAQQIDRRKHRLITVHAVWRGVGVENDDEKEK